MNYVYRIGPWGFGILAALIVAVFGLAAWASLGTGGITVGPSAQRIPQDFRSGWELLRGRQTSNETALTDMDDPPADALAVYPLARFVDLAACAIATAKTATVELYGWPPDPTTGTGSTQNDTDGNAAGWLIGTYTLVSTARTQTSTDAGEADTVYQSNIEAVDLAGAAWIAARITSVGGSEIEVNVRWR